MRCFRHLEPPPDPPPWSPTNPWTVDWDACSTALKPPAQLDDRDRVCARMGQGCERHGQPRRWAVDPSASRPRTGARHPVLKSHPGHKPPIHPIRPDRACMPPTWLSVPWARRRSAGQLTPLPTKLALPAMGVGTCRQFRRQRSCAIGASLSRIRASMLVASTVGCEVGLAGHRRDW